MTFQAINFSTSIADIYDARGRRIDRELGRGVYRNDTGELISIVGKNTKTIDHMEVLSPILDHYDAQGYAIEERTGVRRSELYDLRGRKGVFVSAKSDKNGAVARVDLITGDFIEPKAGFSRAGDNTMFNRITLLNSHDGSLAVHCNTSYLRLVCLNGMVDAKWTVNTRAKHTLRLDVESLKARIRNGAAAAGGDLDRFQTYANTTVSPTQAAAFFQQTIGKLADKTDGTPNWSEPLVRELLVNFRDEDQTAWGLWNAMTAWASHGKRKQGSSVVGTLLGREERVARAMRQPEWDALLAA